MSIKRIGILTGGGDCPGLNAVIRGVTKTAINKHHMEVIGFQDGFLGLIEERFIKLFSERVSGILQEGGTILGSSNTANPFAHKIMQNGEWITVDKSDQCMELYNDLGLDALVCVGGDGTMSIAGELAKKGANIIGVPKTIDKDLMETDTTFGFDTARSIVTEAIDRLHTTAQSHHRAMLVEVMGRNAGWLALESGLAGGGDIILIPEIPYDIEEIVSVVRKRSRFGKKFSIIVVSEGAKPIGGEQVVKKVVENSPDPVRLGGISHIIAEQIEKLTDIEARVTILGHLQRGGTPTSMDRILATQFAVKAMDLVVEKKFGHMVVLKGNKLTSVPVEKVMNKQRTVPKDCFLVRAGLDVGVSYGVKEL